MDRTSLADRTVTLLQQTVPDAAVRSLMGAAIARRSRREHRRGDDERTAWLRDWSSGPIATATPAANEQHYEVDTALFDAMLGPRLKYSACRWRTANSLADAENEMLAATVAAANLRDGMSVLDMGSGWGSLSGYIVDHFPDCQVDAVSTSATQHASIEHRYPTVRHHTVDIAEFEPDRTYDRIISVEMVEHLRNHALLFDRLRHWLAPNGRVMLHHFAHRTRWYPFDDDGAGAWMARRFFTGGIMPSHDFFDRVLDSWEVVHHEWIDGGHYAKTLDTWLDRLDAYVESGAVVDDLDDWRWFLMACSELFGRGDEWGVTHIALEPR